MIQQFADWFVFTLLKISSTTPLGDALNFFVYDTLKILLLLFLISAIMGVVNAYFPIERLRSYLSSHRLYGLQYLLASLFGAITPFCSCSSIPLFIGFVKGGIPLGVTFSFLITSPLVNEVAIAMFIGTFGMRITAIYIVSGIFMGMVGGWLLGKLKLESLLSPWVRKIQMESEQETATWQAHHIGFMQRLPVILKDSWDIVRGVILYVFIGIAVGAAIHGYVPEQFFEQHLAVDAWWNVPLSVLLAVPMYSNAAGVVPIIEVFVQKGVPIGTALAFMMAVVGLSLPEATLLKKAMTWRLIGIFFGVVTLIIITLGYIFNATL
jgi:uncharacterized membrane protein YraQ (UPF0718 family)